MSARRPRGAAARAAPAPPPSDSAAPAEPPPRSPYALFQIQVSLSTAGQIHNTTVTHATSKEEERWPGWNPELLTAFVMRHVAPSSAEPLARAPEHVLSPPVSISFEPGGLAHPRVAGAPFDLRLSVVPADPPAGLSYAIEAYARPLAGGARMPLASQEGALAADQRRLTLRASPLAPGLYRLGASLTLRAQGSDAHWQLPLEGEVIQVT